MLTPVLQALTAGDSETQSIKMKKPNRKKSNVSNGFRKPDQSRASARKIESVSGGKEMEYSYQDAPKMGTGGEQAKRKAPRKASADLARREKYKVTPFTLAAGHGNVLCVDGHVVDPQAFIALNGNPVRGKIYRVLGIFESTGGLRILGFPTLDITDGQEVGWNPDRFVVLAPTKT